MRQCLLSDRLQELLQLTCCILSTKAASVALPQLCLCGFQQLPDVLGSLACGRRCHQPRACSSARHGGQHGTGKAQQQHVWPFVVAHELLAAAKTLPSMILHSRCSVCALGEKCLPSPLTRAGRHTLRTGYSQACQGQQLLQALVRYILRRQQPAEHPNSCCCHLRALPALCSQGLIDQVPARGWPWQQGACSRGSWHRVKHSGAQQRISRLASAVVRRRLRGCSKSLCAALQLQARVSQGEGGLGGWGQLSG